MKGTATYVLWVSGFQPYYNNQHASVRSPSLQYELIN